MKKFDNLKESIEANIQIDNFFSFRNLLNGDNNETSEHDSLIGLVNDINIYDNRKKKTSLQIIMDVNCEMDNLKESLNKTFVNLNITISRNKSIRESKQLFNNETSRFNRTTDNICNIFDNDLQNELNSIRKIQNNENKQKYESYHRSHTSLSNKQTENQISKHNKKEDTKHSDSVSINYKQQMEKYKEFLKSQGSNNISNRPNK